jgi:hypothetical protein
MTTCRHFLQAAATPLSKRLLAIHVPLGMMPQCFFSEYGGTSSPYLNLLVRDDAASPRDRGGRVLEQHRLRDWIGRMKLHVPVAGLALFGLLSISSEAAPPRAALDDSHRTFLREHCTTCHDAEKQKGKVRLDDIPFVLDDIPTADLWQKVLNSVNSGEMPPEDEPQPTDEAKTAFLDALSGTLVTAREVLSDVEGRITMRRLNRREYKNTIRDLLGVAVPAGELPADGGAGTFDTVGSSLFMSSDQFEQYLALGRQAVDEHFARFVAPVPGKEWKLRIEVEGTNQRIQKGFEERTDARRRYLEWTTAVDAAAAKPENAALADRIRAEKKDDPRHLHEEWQRIPGAPAPTAFGFTDAVHAEQMGRRDWDHFVPHHRAYLEHPLTKTGTFLTIDDAYVNSRQIFQLPGDWPPGDYVLRVRIAAMDGIPRERHFVEFGPQDPSGVCTVSSTHEVTGTAAQPQVLEIPLKLTESKTRLFMFRERGSHESDAAASRLFAEAKQRNGMGPELALWIDWIEVASKPAATLPVGKPQKLRKDPEQWANQYMPIYAKGYAEKYERFQKWCAAIDEAARKPENAEAVAKLRGDPRLKTQPHLFYNGFAQLQGAPAPTQFGFRDVDDAQFARSEYIYHFRYYDDYQKLPARETGTWLMLYSLGRYTGIRAPEKWPAGQYTLRIRLAASDESPKERRFIEIGTGKADAADFNVLSSHQVTGTLANPQTLEIPVTINASGDRNFAIRDKRPNNRAAEYAMFREAWDKTGTGPRPCIWVDFVELEGPVNRLASPVLVAKPHSVRVEPEEWANEQIPLAIQKYKEPYDRYLRWTTAVDEAARTAENAETARKWREDNREKAEPSLFYNHWQELKAAPSPTKFGFTDTADAQFARSLYRLHHQYHVDYLKLPQRDTGAYLMLKSNFSQYAVTADGKWPVGSYLLRVRLAAAEDSPAERRFVQLVQGPWNEHVVLSSHQVTGTLTNPQVLEIPIEITTTGKREFILRDKRPNDRAAESDLFYASLKEHGTGPRPCIWIDWMEITGPVIANTPTLSAPKTIRQRREVELHANAMVGGTYNGYFKGGYEAAKKFLETKQPQKGIPDEQEAKFRIRGFEQVSATFERYLHDPLTQTGAYLTIYNVHTEEVITLPPDQPSGWLKTKHEVEEAEPGEYVLRFRIGAVKGTPEERHFVALGSRMKPDEREDFTLMQTFQVSGTTDAPQTIEVPVSITAGGPRTFVLREKRDVKLDHELFTTAVKETKVGPPPALWIDWVEWEGPLRKPAAESDSGIPPVLSRGETDPRAVLERFAARAFRGKTPSAAYLDKLTALHEARIAAGDPYDKAIREPLSVILASPGFLYIQEVGALGADNPTWGQSDREKVPVSPSPRLMVSLSPAELASRLSYFLWSAPPDDALLAADLTDLVTLAREVDRLIASPKADEFVSGFVHQWLHLDRLDFFQFDTKQFRDFDESAKAAARREVYETFAHLLRNRGSLSRLLKSDEIHVNGLLATYYGIEGVSGDEFRPVKVPEGSPRGGLLGMAAVLAMGSNGERTSPVERGAWVLRYLLHNPPPPAPPNVPQLDRLDGKPVSPRDRLLAHQEEPQCLQCHRKIDPIGFGLENFNAAGKWREVDSDPKSKKEWPIDPAGAFHHGPAFKNYFELRDLVAARSDDFARGFTEALIEYGLGRPYGFTDDALASDIVARAKEEDHAIRAFIQALAASEAFRRK